MAGIPGEPAPKPSNLPPADPFAAAQISQAAADPFAAAKAPDQIPGSQAQPLVNPNSFAGKGVQLAADAAPTATAMAGGVLGFGMGGPIGSIAGAGVGGAAGQGYRQWIETNILGKQLPDSPLTDAGVEGAKQAAYQTLGLGVGKGAELATKTKVGQATMQWATEQAAPIVGYVGHAIQATRDKIEEPAMKFIAENASKLLPEAAGDAVKQALGQNIKSKYGPFIQAYADLDTVGKVLPISDKANLKFFDSTMNWAREELGGDQYRVVKKFAQDFVDAGNGAKFDSVVMDVRDAIRVANKTGQTEQVQVLKALRDKATDFMEGETTKLAARVASGTASEAEVATMQQIAQQRGLPPEESSKYAKQLARDFLKSKDQIKNDYAGFRSFLEDVGEQTKTRVTNKGPMQFLDGINDIPSEQLVEKMFQSKNAAALRTMAKETPEVYQQVVSSKLSQLVEQSSTAGKLDLAAFRTAVNKLPPDTRPLIMTGEQRAMLNSVIDNPRLLRLQAIEKRANGGVMKTMAELAEVGRTIGGKAAAQVAQSVPGKQLMGLGAAKAGSALYNTFAPQSLQDPNQ